MSRSADDPDDALRQPNRVFEPCEECGRETLHSVAIEIEPDTRRPYRVSVCDQCEQTERLRINNQ
jgi:hypothetical protein